MKVIDIRPDSKLLIPNFDGYKLSLEQIPVIQQNNTPAPLKIEPTGSEYSFLHSSLFQLHNFLIADPWLNNTCYYLDSSNFVQKISYDVNTGKLKPVASVFKVPGRKVQSDDGGVYNGDIRFISEKFALLSDGVGNLFIIETGDRQKTTEWKLNQPGLQLLDGTGFIIQDGKLVIENGEKLIHCLILHIKQDDGKFFNVIDWFTLKQNDKNFSQISRRTLQGKGSLQYLSFDPKANAVVYSSSKEYKFTYDTEKEIVEEVKPEIPAQLDHEPQFKWSQDSEDITVKFQRKPESTKDQYKVKSEKNHIEVTFQSEVLLKSDLFAEVDSDLTTWSLENDFLQLTLIKKEPELNWPYLIPGGPPMDSDNPDPLVNAPVQDLTSQMEDCDFDGINEDEEFFIARLDPSNHKISHKIFLSSNQALFSTVLRPGQPRAIALRSDVDCCLWLQQTSPSDNSDWSLKHEATLHAFGYVQASKRERKYLQCSPDTNMSVISEISRHLFIYKNSYSTASGLRKRSGPQLVIGQQKLVSFDGSNGEILGISVENEAIILLFEKSVCCLQLSIEE